MAPNIASGLVIAPTCQKPTEFHSFRVSEEMTSRVFNSASRLGMRTKSSGDKEALMKSEYNYNNNKLSMRMYFSEPKTVNDLSIGNIVRNVFVCCFLT